MEEELLKAGLVFALPLNLVAEGHVCMNPSFFERQYVKIRDPNTGEQCALCRELVVGRRIFGGNFWGGDLDIEIALYGNVEACEYCWEKSEGILRRLKIDKGPFSLWKDHRNRKGHYFSHWIFLTQEGAPTQRQDIRQIEEIWAVEEGGALARERERREQRGRRGGITAQETLNDWKRQIAAAAVEMGSHKMVRREGRKAVTLGNQALTLTVERAEDALRKVNYSIMM